MPKTFTFTKSKIKDLSGSPELGATTIKVGQFKFTMQDYHYNPYGHDDTLSYSAILCVNDKPLAHCSNDGWGGMSDISYLPQVDTTIENEIKTYQWKYKNIKINLNLSMIADILAETCEMLKKC